MITSNGNPKVKQVVQWQTKAKERRRGGIFLAEGFKMYAEAPEEDILEVYVAENALEQVPQRKEIQEKLVRTGFETVSSQVFQKMSDTQTPQGILCVIRQRIWRLETLLQAPDPLFLVLEGLQDPGNLGTIVRSCEGAGVTGIFMDKETVDIYNPKVIRATMGSVYRVPFVCVEDLPKTVDRLREKGILVYAAHLDGKRYYDGVSFRAGTAFLIGNEGRGLRRELADRADDYLKIPMEGQVESLNAAIAASLFVYEAHRQRHMIQG